MASFPQRIKPLYGDKMTAVPFEAIPQAYSVTKLILLVCQIFWDDRKVVYKFPFFLFLSLFYQRSKMKIREVDDSFSSWSTKRQKEKLIDTQIQHLENNSGIEWVP